MSRTLTIAAIPGDGIGLEVLPVAMQVVARAAERAGATIRWVDYDWGSERYRRSGRMMPVDGLQALEGQDAIFFGAVGDPEIPDVETLWGLLIPMRRTFDQYVKLRPARSFPCAPAPLADGAGIDLL